MQPHLGIALRHGLGNGLGVAMTEAELAVILAAAALPPPQRALFQERVAAELKSLPCGMIGPGTLHRVIAAAQKIILAVGPSFNHGGNRMLSRPEPGPGPSEPAG